MNNLRNNILKTLLSTIILTASTFSFSQDELFNKAMTEINGLNRVKAESLLNELLLKYPNHTEAHYQAGLIDINFEKTELAIDHFNKVIKLKGKDTPGAYFELSKLKIASGEKEEAMIMLDKVLQLDEANSEAYFKRGQLKFMNEDYESAKSDFNRALLMKTSAMYYYDRALTEIELQDYPSAIDDLSKVIETKPEFEDAYFYRGYSYYKEGLSPDFTPHKALFKKCLADYDKCIELNPEDDAAYFNRGEAHMRLKEYVPAIADFKHTIALNPNDKEAHYNKAVCNYKYGYEDQALKEFKSILKMDPKYSDALFQVGVISYEFGDYEEALQAFNTLIETEEEHADAFTYRGLTNLELKNIPEACSDWKKADEMSDKEAHHDYVKYCSKKKKK